MKKSSLICLLYALTALDTFACREPNMSYDELAMSADAVYVGGIMSIAIPDMQKDDMNVDLHYPNVVNRQDRVIKMKVHQTLSGGEQEMLNVTLTWCDGKNAKLGEMGILYQLENGWYLRHDDFAISEATAILTTQSYKSFSNIASH